MGNRENRGFVTPVHCLWAETCATHGHSTENDQNNQIDYVHDIDVELRVRRQALGERLKIKMCALCKRRTAGPGNDTLMAF